MTREDSLVACPPGPHTHSVGEVCTLIGCDSEDWFVDRVRNGTFPSRRVVRQLRFSDSDIQQIIEACTVREAKPSVASVPIPTSRRKTA